jgi:hypothetical protein
MTEPDRDDKVRRAYRALGGEEPARALDEAILAASRRPQHRWRVPLSIAAVLVLAVGVTLRMLPQRQDAESVAFAPQVIQAPKPAAEPAAPAAKFAQDVPGAAAPIAEAPSAAARSVAGARAKPAERGPQLASEPAPAALESARRAEASAPVAAAAVAGSVQRDAAEEDRARALASAPPAPSAAAAAKLPEATLAPEAWLNRIAELRKEGRGREAQESLAEFRKRYPNYKIPEALLR